MLIPIPTVLYLDAAIGIRTHWVVPAVCWMSVAEYIICTILHFTGVMDYHDTMTVTHVLLAIAAVVLFIVIVRALIITEHKPASNIYRIFRTVGLTGISFATVIDIIRFYRGNGTDSALCVRIGLLLFVICFGVSSLEKTVNAVRLGIRSEFVSQLAYKDGLTGIGNRTAFEECLADYEKEKDRNEIAIVMFDVNDLKYVNDHMGHRQGDSMLVESSKLIKKVFAGSESRCFRIGGDEFAVVVKDRQVKAQCITGLEQFAQRMQEYNAQPKQPFRISIASGYAICGEDEKLINVYQKADARMYENKKEMKSHQISPEEYYKEREA
jgi:diguanylate cyclase (GGDEF)-like protein